MNNAKFQKGERVEITRGRSGVGVCGEVFWKGESKYSDGERLGVRGDDGETYWVDDSEVKAATGGPPPPAHTFDKGDRVSFRQRGREGTGTVFWIGQSRSGPGQRLGIRDDDGEEGDDAVWLDARLATPLEGDSPGAAGDLSPDTPDDGAPWTAPLSMNELPPPPPVDDGLIDAWASATEDGDDPAW